MECLARAGARLGARYIMVYGGRARGYAGPHSDYDVAVKLGRRPGLRERGMIYALLARCVPGRLDLAFLDDGDPILAWEALARGRLVYACGRECLEEYYEDLARAIDLVADLEPLLRLFRREARRALAGARG